MYQLFIAMIEKSPVIYLEKALLDVSVLMFLFFNPLQSLSG